MATANKTQCPITRAAFKAGAQPIKVTLPGGVEATLEPREFSPSNGAAHGSFGWHFGDKLTLDVGGVKVKCQGGFLLTVVGSKEVAQ
jgi:hypothetical protein